MTWADTPAGRALASLGLPLADEAEITFAAELGEREQAARRFRVAHDLEDDAGRVTARGRYLAELRDTHRVRYRSWICLTDDEARELVRRMRAGAAAEIVAAEAVSYGPPEGNPRTAAAMSKIRQANERIGATQNGGPWSAGGHVGRTVQ
jgi:hypothetical protein